MEIRRKARVGSKIIITTNENRSWLQRKKSRMLPPDC